MSKLAAALLTVTILFGVANSSRPLANVVDKLIPHLQTGAKETRQDTCTLPTTYPQSCTDAANDVANLLMSADTNPENINLDDLNSALGEFCTTECIGPQVEFYRCLGEQDFANLFNSAYCGQNGDSYCIVSLLTGVNDNSVPEITCTVGSTCDSSCQSTLQRAADYLGCCAASLYNNTLSPFSALISPQDFATCDVSLGQMCAGPVSGAGVHHVGLALLTIAAAFAALINSLM